MLALRRRWNPFGELSTLHQEMDEFFKRTFGAMGGLTRGFFGEAWAPNVESFVKEGSIVVRAEVPGIEPKDIDISVVGNQLIIKGERKATKETKGEEYLMNEVCYGSFERMITLPEGVKVDNIHASYKNGILEITMPAEKAALPRKVAIELAEGGAEKGKKAA